MHFSAEILHKIHQRLHSWYDQCGRRLLPWRNTRDPYAIWVSEVMLQQTQVTTVLEKYYAPFLERFPTVQALAAAELEEVLKCWEGLGYYTRAANLHKAARVLVRANQKLIIEGQGEGLRNWGTGELGNNSNEERKQGMSRRNVMEAEGEPSLVGEAVRPIRLRPKGLRRDRLQKLARLAGGEAEADSLEQGQLNRITTPHASRTSEEVRSAAPPQGGSDGSAAGDGYQVLDSENSTKHSLLPHTILELLALPGIGKNTAHAISAFAYHSQVPVMEANVKRILARVFALESPVDKELWQYAEMLLDHKDPFIYNQAMMDVGALICTKTNPQCGVCPLNIICEGKENPEKYPAPKKKKMTRIRKKQILVYQDGEYYAVQRRTTKFLHGLYGFVETDAEEGAESGVQGAGNVYTPTPEPGLSEIPQLRDMEGDESELRSFSGSEPNNFKLGEVRQVYSHFILEAEVFLIECGKTKNWEREPENWGAGELANAALHTPASEPGSKIPHRVRDVRNEEGETVSSPLQSAKSLGSSSFAKASEDRLQELGSSCRSDVKNNEASKFFQGQSINTSLPPGGGVAETSAASAQSMRGGAFGGPLESMPPHDSRLRFEESYAGQDINTFPVRRSPKGEAGSSAPPPGGSSGDIEWKTLAEIGELPLSRADQKVLQLLIEDPV